MWGTNTFLLKVFAFLALAAAVYHAVGMGVAVDQSPVWRHGLFVCINLFCAYGFWYRPKYFFYFLVVLVVQQYYSHGSYMLRYWNEQHRVHWISFFDLLLLPVALWLLYRDRTLAGPAGG